MSMLRPAWVAMIALILIPWQSIDAQDDILSLKSSFRVGSEGVLCTAQYSGTDPRLSNMFDRAYRLVCRDAAASVGSLLVLKKNGSERANAIIEQWLDQYDCETGVGTELADLEVVAVIDCRDRKLNVGRRIYQTTVDDSVFLAEGLTGYDSVLTLGLRSLVMNRQIPGRVDVALTSASDPSAFARVQAGALDAGSAREEAYRRNVSGNYAEAIEFFETLLNRNDGNSRSSAEYLANQALQQSNLGQFVAANALFERATRQVASNDGVTQRMIRNFRTLHLLNQQDPAAALVALETPVAPPIELTASEEIATGFISPSIAELINRENRDLKKLGAFEARLLPRERAEILDGQALLLRGTALRLQGLYSDAQSTIDEGLARIGDVRSGQVRSIGWLQAEMLSEQALIAEAEGDIETADRQFGLAVTAFKAAFPQSPATLSAKTRYANFLVRQGQLERALTLYGEVVDETERVSGSSAMIRNLIAPYFSLLVDSADELDDRDDRLFRASQLLERPGVAQTQAILARELSEGDGEAAALFRLSLARERSIVSTTAEIDRLANVENLTSSQAERLANARETLDLFRTEQTAILSRLAQYSQYRALSPGRLSLAELQSLLEPEEAYFKISIIGENVYAQYIQANAVRSLRIPLTTQKLESLVSALRDSIIVIEFGQPTTYPFDVVRSRELYQILFGELESELATTRHLVFEPDGPLLQLPPGLLLQHQEPIDAYLEIQEQPDADPFNMAGLPWLARDLQISIAVSEKSFQDIRKIAPSNAKLAYLGVGTNAIPQAQLIPSVQQTDACHWPISTWQSPIASDELQIASQALGQSRSRLLTGTDFTDQALLTKQNLSDFRIVHFATHGLVTAPKPHCPARPALVTSFDNENSDGLLSFQEIFDLRLDADLVVLSACDTAGMATAAASREAGISTGGNYALDGLVRAFVGAGARSVLASHWPVPDDYDATKRLMSGMFEEGKSLPINQALQQAQLQLMDDPLTSHPYYWAAFVLLGDGMRPLAIQTLD